LADFAIPFGHLATRWPGDAQASVSPPICLRSKDVRGKLESRTDERAISNGLPIVRPEEAQGPMISPIVAPPQIGDRASSGIDEIRPNT